MRPLVLNTRSTSQAGEFSTLLKKAGFDVLETPALEIKELDCSQQIVSALQSLDPKEIVVFTSANAAAIASQNPKVKNLLLLRKVAAIGNKTASTLKEVGITVHLQSVQSSSEDLAELIASERPKKVLYLSGIPNTGTLKSRLSGLTDFIEVPVYTSSPSPNLQDNLLKYRDQIESVDYLVFLSKESLFAFHDTASSLSFSLSDRKCVVISRSVADAARLLGYKNVSVSQARSVEAIVASLESLSFVV